MSPLEKPAFGQMPLGIGQSQEQPRQDTNSIDPADVKIRAAASRRFADDHEFRP